MADNYGQLQPITDLEMSKSSGGGAGGGFDLGNIIGVGAGLLGMFGGGKAPKMKKIVMSSLGPGLLADLKKSLDTDLPRNIADVFKGRALKKVQAQQKAVRREVAYQSFRSPEKTISGRRMTGGLLALGRGEIGGRGEVEQADLRAKRAWQLSNLSDRQKVSDIMTRLPIAQARSSAFSTEMDQLRGAGYGANAGAMLQMMALSRVMNSDRTV
jgi:hypothetical protein